jgi:cell division protein FtsA
MTPKPIIATGIDAGSAYTRVIIGLVEENRLRFLGCGCAPSTGWAKSRIVDQQAASRCILAAVEQAEAMAGVHVETAVAGVGGLSVRGASSRGLVELTRPREIEQRDVNRAMQRAMKVQLQEDRMLLHVLPQAFVVDDNEDCEDPRRMMAATRLVANAHLVTMSAHEHNTVTGAINLAHLAVDETVYEPIASGYASVLPEERPGGIVVVDIGAHSTEIICYFGESVQLAATIRICGDHFSRDIAFALHVPLEDGALVKEEFGSALASGTAENSMVELPFRDEAGRESREVQRLLVNRILESRTQELFAMVKEELIAASLYPALANGVVLTGAGALLPGICDVAERELDRPARIGLTQGYRNFPVELKDPAWTTAAGLSMYAARLRTQVDLERRQTGLLGKIFR